MSISRQDLVDAAKVFGPGVLVLAVLHWSTGAELGLDDLGPMASLLFVIFVAAKARQRRQNGVRPTRPVRPSDRS